MPLTESKQAREVLLNALKHEISELGLAKEDLTGSFNLIEDGLLDSFGFLELMARIEDQAGIELDFEGREPDDLTSISGLGAIIEAALNEEPPG